MDRTLIIGLGTGRCGTTTLSALLNSQNNCDVTHEAKELSHVWKYDELDFNNFVETLAIRPELCVGDVAFYHLNYVEPLIKRYMDYWDEIRFIYLKRDKQEVIKSYLNWWYGGDDLWTLNGQGDEYWRERYPKFDVATRKQGILEWWNFALATIENLEKRFPDKIMIFNTNDLSNPIKVDGMLDFIGFPETDKKVITNIHSNKAKFSGMEE